MSDNLFDRVVVAIGGQYLVDGEIGRGGSGVVYRGTDLRLGRQVAIKVLPPELAYNESVKTRFIREAQTAAGLSHPNIVPIYSVDEREGLVYFVMALVVGQSVASHLSQDHSWPADRTERVLREVADALAYAHSRGVVHRDIKPDNILIERDSGRALVSDFGIARASEGETRLTLTGVAVGTPAYMSPEQALGERELDGRSDVYSLGVVGYHMLTGEQPFKASSAAAMLVKHVSEIPPRVHQKRPQVPRYLAAAIDRALAKRPEERWSNASEFRDALAGAVTLPPQGFIAADPRAINGALMARDRSHAPAPVPRHSEPVRPEAPRERSSGEPRFEDYWRPTPPPPGLSSRELRRWVKEQERHRKVALKRYQEDQVWRHAADQNQRSRQGTGKSYDDKPLIDRVLAFRGAVVRFAFITPILLVINAESGGFPWFLFPSSVFLFDALRRAGSIWSDGIGPLDAFRKGIRVRLSQGVPLEPHPYGREREQETRSLRPAGTSTQALPPRTARAERFPPPPPDKALSGVPTEVMNGAHGAAVRRALDDSSVIRDALMRLGPLEREMLPDIAPTVDALTERVAGLATTLHRLDLDVSGATLGTLDDRIAQLRRESSNPDRQRTLTLLERQRTSLNDLLSRRQLLLGQLDSAGLALQNLKLDLLKLRSAGVSAAMDGGSTATQEARSVSRDIGRVIEVADEFRDM